MPRPNPESTPELTSALPKSRDGETSTEDAKSSETNGSDTAGSEGRDFTSLSPPLLV